MKKNLFKMISYLMVAVLLLALPYATVDAASTSYVKTVTSQKDLNVALKSNTKTIIIKSSKAIKLVIGEKEYSDKTVFVNAPKAVVVNSAKFKKVEITSNSKGSWTEKGKNNTFVIESDKAKLIVGKAGIIKKITTNKEEGQLNLIVYGEVKNLTVNENSNINISGTGSKELLITVKAKDTVIHDANKVTNIENRSTGTISVYVAGYSYTIEKGEKIVTKEIAAQQEKDKEEKEAEEKEAEEKDTDKEDSKVKDSEDKDTEDKDAINQDSNIIPFPSGNKESNNNGNTGAGSAGTGSAGTGSAGTGNTGSESGSSDHTGNNPGNTTPVHTHSYSDSVTKEPTCTEAGIRTYICEANDHSYVEAIPAIGHQYTSTITKAATCTEAGTRTYCCSNCSDTYTDTISASGHVPGAWEIETEATVIADGLKVQKCTKCDVILQTEIIHKLPCEHTYTASITKAATCIEDGVKTYSCSICGISYTEVIPVIPHIYSSEVTVPATTTTEGQRSYTCTGCGSSYTEVIPRNEIPAGDIYTVELTVTDGYTSTSVTGRDNMELAYQVYEKVNELRVSMGLNELTWDMTMDDYTQLRAAEVTQKFSHERPNGERGYEMNDTITSENIGVGYATADEVMEAWINSSAHYNAMINPEYTSVAVGCFEEQIMVNGEPVGAYYTGWVQFFHGDNSILLE